MNGAMGGAMKVACHTIPWRFAVLVCAALVLGAGILGGGAPPAMAGHTSVEDYRERVIDARQAVEEYIETGAEDGPGGLVIDVLTTLPSREYVRIGDVEVLVDNSILWSLVARLDVSRDPDRRLPIAQDIANQLASIERSLPVDGESLPADPEALARLLAHAQTQTRSPVTEILGGLIDRIAAAFERWQASIAESRSASTLWSFAIGTLILALILLLGWLAWRVAVRVLSSTARTGPVVAEEPRSGVPVIDLEAEIPADVIGFAESLAAEQRFAEAIRALFGGAARLLAEYGHVTRTRTRTNNELVDEVRGSVPAVVGPLGALASSFERVFYGHVEPGPDGYRAALADYTSLRAAATPAEGGETS